MIDDDLRSKTSADVKIRERRSKIFFDRADGESSGIIEAGAERNDKQFCDADAVLIQRIVERGVAGLIVFFILFLSGLLGLGACCQRTNDEDHRKQQSNNFLEIHVFLLFMPCHMKRQTRRYNQLLVAQG